MSRKITTTNLPEEYQSIVEILEDKLDDDNDPSTIDMIRKNLSVKFDVMNKQSRLITSREDKKIFT